MNIDEVLRYLFPDADPLRDWEVWSDEEKGTRIEVWRLATSQPTAEELTAVYESAEFKTWQKNQTDARIDRETEKAIDKAIHPEAPIGEHFAILREQIEQMLADSGQQPTVKFGAWSDIAGAEIAKGQVKKDALEE